MIKLFGLLLINFFELIIFNLSLKYLRLIDERVTRIVFSKNATDPDFDTYSVDSETIGESGIGLNDNVSSSMRTGSSHDLSTANNVAATENEVQINLMQGRI